MVSRLVFVVGAGAGACAGAGPGAAVRGGEPRAFVFFFFFVGGLSLARIAETMDAICFSLR
eukprot:3973606-Pyramimonas_sp.AAC.1